MSFRASESDALPIFEHHSLPDKPYAIRLIQLSPTSDTDHKVSCTLVPSDLKELPHYKALSYVWGDPCVTRNIYIGRRPYPVTQNCYAALTCLQSKNTQVTLWIDAICINQRDRKEKNQQLAIMVDIYTAAEEVLIWMGLNNTPLMEGLSLDRLRHIEKLLANTIIDLTNPSDLKVRYNVILVDPPESDVKPVWGALIAIFTHPWWVRLWVHQELAVASKAAVVVGRHTFAWDLLLSLLQLLCANNFEYSKAELQASPKLEFVVLAYWQVLNSSGFQSISSRFIAPNNEKLRKAMVRLHNQQFEIGEVPIEDFELLDLNARETMELLQWTRRYHCTDPRDHVFALRGLLTDGKILAEADYTKSTKDVYARFARMFINLYQSTNILRLAGITSRGVDSSDDLGACSSWIPYLGTVDDFGLFSKVSNPLWTLDDDNYFAAAKGLGRQAEIAENGEKLSIFGYPVDTLDTVQSFATQVKGMSFEDYNRAVWRELTQNLPPSYPTGCRPKEALFRTLTAGRNAISSDPSVPPQQYVANSTKWTEHEWILHKLDLPEISTQTRLPPMTPCPGTLPHSMSENKQLEPTTNFASAICLSASIDKATACRKFLRTERGFLGLAPRLAEVGDEVWILLGCDVPMLLRKYADCYTIVGECFVYGMMEGEQAKSLLESGELKNVTLH